MTTDYLTDDYIDTALDGAADGNVEATLLHLLDEQALLSRHNDARTTVRRTR